MCNCIVADLKSFVAILPVSALIVCHLISCQITGKLKERNMWPNQNTQQKSFSKPYFHSDFCRGSMNCVICTFVHNLTHSIAVMCSLVFNNQWNTFHYFCRIPRVYYIMHACLIYMFSQGWSLKFDFSVYLYFLIYFVPPKKTKRIILQPLLWR